MVTYYWVKVFHNSNTPQEYIENRHFKTKKKLIDFLINCEHKTRIERISYSKRKSNILYITLHSFRKNKLSKLC